MRAGVVAHGGAAHFVVDHGVDFVADVDRLLGDDTMRTHALHGIGRAFDLGDERVVIVAVEPADIADLSAGVGVEGRVVEDNLAALAGLELLCADTAAVVRLDDGENLRAGGERLVIALEPSTAKIGRPGWPIVFEPPFHDACARGAALSMAASKPAESKLNP